MLNQHLVRIEANSNTRLCPLLNGTIKSDGGAEQGGFGGFTPGAAASPPV